MTEEAIASIANTKGRRLSFVFAFVLTVVLVGALSALFLLGLGLATKLRESHLWFVYLLPLAGAALAFASARYAKDALRGVVHVVSAHTSQHAIPKTLAPLILLGTVWTHLFGGSAGREGTAVQMGATVSDAIARATRLDAARRAILLRVGVSAGFAAVFGTPLAGAVFSVEWVSGPRRLRMFGWVAIAAFCGDVVARNFGAAHPRYPAPGPFAFHGIDLCRWIAFGVAVAAFAKGFLVLSRKAKEQFFKVSNPMLRAAMGGFVVLLLWRTTRFDDLLGLSLQTLHGAFTAKSPFLVPLVLKLLLTIITLGAGFLGGEVTPLFVMGALLGRSVGDVLGMPFELAAALGVCSLFSVCARVPWTGLFLGYELFGANVILPAALVVAVGSRLLGKSGLYDH